MKLFRTLTGWIREKLVLGPILFYQRHISPCKPACCRFIPSCSQYAVTAVRRFGALRGGLMAVCRILRCNPLCTGGYDPVPGHFSLRPFAGLSDPGPGKQTEFSTGEEDL